MKKVGFVGVGNIGMGMAKSILRKGFELTVYDIRKQALKEIAQAGARIAKSSREVGEKSDVVLIQVVDSPQVKKVVSGKEGLLEGMRPGSIIICGSTILHSEIEEVAETVEQRGIKMVDCAVSGAHIRAVEGTLTLMVAAKKDVFDECKEIFQAIGRDIYHVGEKIGMGQVTKACQLVLAEITLAGMAEALVLGVKAGIKPEVLYGAISTSTVGSFQFNHWAKLVIERNFTTGPRIGDIVKCLEIITKTGRDYGVPLYTTAAAYEMAKAAQAIAPEGDMGVIVKPLEKITGVEVEKTT